MSSPSKGTPLSKETDVQQGDWWRRWDATNKRCYWANTKTMESSWVQPAEWVDDEVKTEAKEENGEKKYNTIGTNWLAIKDPGSGRTYFANAKTGESTWSIPDELKIDWRAMTDKTGRPYYYNASNGETTWEMPDELAKQMLEKALAGDLDNEIEVNGDAAAPPAPDGSGESEKQALPMNLAVPSLPAESKNDEPDEWAQEMQKQARKKARAKSKIYSGASLELHKAKMAAKASNGADAAAATEEKTAPIPEADEDSEDEGNAEVVPQTSEEELKQIYSKFCDISAQIKQLRLTESKFNFPESVNNNLNDAQHALNQVISYLHNDLDALCIGGRDNVQSLVEFGRMPWTFDDNKICDDYREKAASFNFQHCEYKFWECPEILSSCPMPAGLAEKSDCWINIPNGGAALDVACTTLASDAIKKAVERFFPGADPSKYVLKAHGFNEMMYSDIPLIEYKFVRDRVITNKAKPLLVVPRPEKIVPPPMPTPVPTTICDIPEGVTIMDTVEANWSLKVGALVNCSRESLPMMDASVSNIFVESFLFHGHEVIENSTVNTKPLEIKNTVNFNEKKDCKSLKIGDLPRETRLCVLLYGGKGSTKVLLAWAVRALVNQNNQLITETKQDFKMWPVTPEDTEKREEMRTRKLIAIREQQVKERQEKVKNKEIAAGTLGKKSKKNGTLKGGEVDITGDDQVAGEDILPDYYFVFSETTRDNNQKDMVPATVTIEFDHLELPKVYAPLVFDPVQGDSNVLGKTLSRKMMETAGMFNRYNRLINQDVLYSLLPADKQMLWMVRNELPKQTKQKSGAPPNLLPMFLASVNWQNAAHRTEAHRVLAECARPSNLAIIVDLLSHKFADYTVRSFAVDCLRDIKDDDVLRQYLLQLTQCLKAEPQHDSLLATFLLERAIANPLVIGHFLFWHLKAETVEANFCERFAMILETYIKNCELSAQELRKQNNTILKLQRVAEHVVARRAKQISKKDNKASFKAEMAELNDNFFSRMLGGQLQVPLFPSCQVTTLIVDSCNFFSSKMAPLLLVFKNVDPGAPPVFIMFKSGDDLRQDILTLQLMSTMDKMWLAEGLDMKMSAYSVIATGVNSENKGVGMLEIVLDSETTSGIQLEKGASGAWKEDIIDQWIKTNNPGADQFAVARDNFMKSMAGYCIATSILGIGDRHNGNIMVKKDGCFFHIDFGHFLGNFKSKYGVKRERVPFVFTPDLAFVVGGKQKSKDEKKRYALFEELCGKAFNVLRKPDNSAQLMGLFKAMTSAGMPELQQEEDIWYMKNRFQLQLEKDAATKWFNDEANKSRKSKFRLLDNFFHNNKHK